MDEQRDESEEEEVMGEGIDLGESEKTRRPLNATGLLRSHHSAKPLL